MPFIPNGVQGRRCVIGWALVLLWGCGPAELTVVMNAQNNSGQNGTATLTDLGSKTRVAVVIRRSQFGENQPVHLHTGRCGEIGPRADRDAGERTLGLGDIRPADSTTMPGIPATDGGYGATSADVDFTFKELTNGSWVINAHDALDFALYVSCGNIN